MDTMSVMSIRDPVTAAGKVGLLCLSLGASLYLSGMK